MAEKKNIFSFEDAFPEDTTAFEDIDEFNLTAPQSVGETEEISSEELDRSISKDEFVAFTGTAEGYPMNEEAFEQIDGMVQEDIQNDTFPAENIVEEAEIEVERELTDNEKERQEKGMQAILDGREIVKETFEDAVQTEINTGLGAKRIREYKNEAVYPKSKFAKAKDGEDTKKKYIFMAAACIGVGIFGGVYSNSYYVFQNGKVQSTLNTAIGWIMQFDTLPVTMTPFDSSSFFAGFGVWAGILAVIFLFNVLNTSQMKNSRVGHEHGNAKIMNASSFKKYKRRFMER